MKKKNKHQVKSKFYYIFWGIATFTVLFGQLYVGIGYREMADEVFYLTEFLRGVEETNVIVDY
jgi:hypothetical protein